MPAASRGDGDAHVRMHLDLIGPEVQHHGTDFAAEGGADRHGRRGEEHRPQARRWSSGKGRVRPGLTLAVALALGIVGRPETVCRGEVGTTAVGRTCLAALLPVDQGPETITPSIKS